MAKRFGRGPVLIGIAGILAVLGLLWFRSGGTDEASEQVEKDMFEQRPRGTFEGSRDVPDARRALLRAAKATVAGHVTDPEGHPIAGANVCVKLDSPRIFLKPLASLTCATSRDDGSYRIEGVLPVEVRVVASAPHHIPAIYRKPERGPRATELVLQPAGEYTEIDIVLKPGGVEVAGVVRDISGGEIEGAQVSAQHAYTQSADDGTFSLWLEPGEASITAHAEGYASDDTHGAVPGHFFEVLLTPESVLIGKVVHTDTGAPVAGVPVFPTKSRWGRSPVTSRDDGTFRIDGLSPGGYKPVAAGETVYGTAAATVHLGLGETSDEVVIRAHPAFFVEGHVLIAGTEDTCLDGNVRLHEPGKKRTLSESVRHDGSVRFEGVLPGTYNVEVRCFNTVPADHYPALEVVEPIAGQAWEVSPGLAIRGIVVDSNGEPVAEQHVLATMVSTTLDPRAKRTPYSFGEETHEDGTFELGGLKPGTYKLRTYGERAGPLDIPDVELSADDVEDVRIELPGEGAVRGRVIDERGEPVANVSIDLESRERSQMWSSRTSTRSADDGTFVLEHLHPGNYRATASRGWTSTLRKPGTTDDDTQGEMVEVVAGEEAEVELRVEARGATIRGRVVDGAGGPIADAFLSATRQSDSATATAASTRRSVRWGQWDQQPVLTDTDGSFAIEHLTEGAYVVRAYRKGGGEGLTEGCQTDTTCEIVIRDTGAVYGQLTLSGGPAPEEFDISLRDRSTGVSRRDTFFRTDGQFSFEQLPGGTYEVNASAGKGNAAGEVTLADGDEVRGFRLDMQAAVTVRGTLVDLDSGEPVSGMQVRITPKLGGSWGGGTSEGRTEISDAQGKFEVANAPSGQVRISVMPPSFTGGDYLWTNLSRTIPADNDVYPLPPIELVKKRVDTEETSGDLGYRLRQRKADEEWTNRELEVAVVLPGGPASKSGLKVGDVIISVDGHDVTGDNLYRYFSLIHIAVGSAVNVGVKRGESFKLVAEPKR